MLFAAAIHCEIQFSSGACFGCVPFSVLLTLPSDDSKDGLVNFNAAMIMALRMSSGLLLSELVSFAGY
jgi:hypothetical protein